jgi:uncharacterized protein YndB with AHSA1/START domain
MSTQTETAVTTQVYRVYIKASAEAIWEAITDPEWTKKYGYHGRNEYDLRPGGAFRGLATAEMIAMGTPEVVVDGEVIEADLPRKLVQTWRFNWSPELVDEGFSRVTWEIKEEDGGIAQLTVIHELDGAPLTSAQVASIAPLAQGGGGWTWILSDLKTLLETGEALEGPTA